MSVTVKFESDDGDLDKSTKKQEDNFDRLRAAERRARTEAAELNRLVKTGSREAETATGKWRRQVDLLKSSLSEGKISQQEFTAGIRQADREFKEATESGQELSGTVRKAVGAFAGFASVGTVLSGVKQVLSEVRQEAEQAGQAASAAISDVGQLQQISANPEDFRRLLRSTSQFQATGAFDRAGASRAAFTFESIGIDTKPFQDLARAGVVSGDGIEELGRAVATVRKNFESLGSESDILSKGFAAAQASPGNIQQILAAASGVATGASAQGISGEQSFAAISTLSELLKSVSESETRLARLFTSAERRGIQSDSIPNLIRDLQKGIQESGKGEVEFLGSQEATEAFRLLRDNSTKFDGILQSVQTAVSRDVLGQRTGLRGADAGVDAALSLRQARASNEIALEQIGSIENLRDAIGLQVDTIRRELGEGAFSRATSRFERGAIRFFGGDGISELGLVNLRDRADRQDNEEASRQVEVLAGLVDQLKRFNDQEESRRNPRVALPAAGAN